MVSNFYLTVLGSVFAGYLLLYSLLSPRKDGQKGVWLPSKNSKLSNNLTKREFEIFALKYTGCWIACFAVVIVFQMYEWFAAEHYMILCVGLSLPNLLQPILFPVQGEKNAPWYMRHSFKANVWIAIFSFIGNYWYTHYFYTVLKAVYTFPAHRLNNVPIALYFATHFYFVTYHTFSNIMLRRIETSFEPGTIRTLFFWATVFLFSYFTAFMETLTISSFPYYCFQDREMVYKIGSAFYGIYFIVSFPVYYRIDEKVNVEKHELPYSLYRTVMDAMGTGMIVLILLDACRLALNVPLEIPGVAYYLYSKKIDCSAGNVQM
jgi:cycloeucalenol cycloisomerase